MKDVVLVIDVQKSYENYLRKEYIDGISNFLEKNLGKEIAFMSDISFCCIEGDFIPESLMKYSSGTFLFKSFSWQSILHLFRKNGMKSKYWEDLCDKKKGEGIDRFCVKLENGAIFRLYDMKGWHKDRFNQCLSQQPHS